MNHAEQEQFGIHLNVRIVLKCIYGSKLRYLKQHQFLVLLLLLPLHATLGGRTGGLVLRDA